MFKKVLLIIGLIFISYSSFAQTSVNDYKYVIVPYQFDFLKEANQYRLNNLTKLLFEKYGFMVLMSDDTLPDDALSNICLVLDANVLKEKGMFNTKLTVQLKNCKDEVIYTSKMGESREKKYQVAYTIALREAFDSFESLNYSYRENPTILSFGSPNTNENKEEIEKLKEEITQLKEEKEKLKGEHEELPVAVKPVAVAVVVKSTPHVEEPKNNIEVQQELTKKVYDNEETLYAQPTKNGFQLVDSTPKVIMVLLKTGTANLFIVKGKDAIVYKKAENIWLYLESDDEKHSERPLNIKF